MKIRHHLLLASISILFWFLYYFAGIPYNYYQNLTGLSMFLLLLITFLSVIPFVAVVVLTFIKVPYLKGSVWLAFYGSLPLLILDYVVLGIIGGHGTSFLISHWHLTVGYVAVWIELPLIGKTLEQLTIKIMNQNV